LVKFCAAWYFVLYFSTVVFHVGLFCFYVVTFVITTNGAGCQKRLFSWDDLLGVFLFIDPTGLACVWLFFFDLRPGLAKLARLFLSATAPVQICPERRGWSFFTPVGARIYLAHMDGTRR